MISLFLFENALLVICLDFFNNLYGCLFFTISNFSFFSLCVRVLRFSGLMIGASKSTPMCCVLYFVPYLCAVVSPICVLLFPYYSYLCTVIPLFFLTLFYIVMCLPPPLLYGVGYLSVVTTCIIRTRLSIFTELMLATPIGKTVSIRRYGI